MTSEPDTPSVGGWRKCIGPAIIAALFIYQLCTTWGRWLDPIVDFGRELYVPWQMSQGRTLYVDIFAIYGPLSQVFNALCFRLFGVSLLTLVIVNIAILIVATSLLYAILRRISTPLAATAGTILFLALFAFGHLTIRVANFNFITPYAHEATHGFTLSLLALYCLIRYVQAPKNRWLIVMGLCTGLVFLTKPEIFVALAGSLGIGLLLAFLTAGGLRNAARDLSLFLAAALFPVASMMAVLTLQMPWALAWRGTLGSWFFLANSSIAGSSFFRLSMGFGNTPGRLEAILTVFAWVAFVLAPALILGLCVPDGKLLRRSILAIGSFITTYVLIAVTGKEYLSSIADILLLSVALLAISQAFMLLRTWSNQTLRRRYIIRLSLILFALLMLLKMLLYTRFYQYGFILAVLATLLLALAILDWIPASLEARRRSGWAFRGAALALLLIVAWMGMSDSAERMKAKTEPLGQGRDAFWADQRGSATRDMVRFMQNHVPADATLTVLPEGIMLNYLTRLRSPVPYISYIPSDVALFGEDHLLAALDKGRPDYIALVHRPTEDFGARNFGYDYAKTIRQWMLANYQPLCLAGATTFQTRSFGILLLRRKNPPPAPLINPPQPPQSQPASSSGTAP